MKNMFTQPLTIYRGEASISPAWREADEFRMSAFAGDYRRTEPEVLAGFVRAALSTLDGENRFSLLRDVEMPFEARADMMWQAAYAITAAGIWLMNQEPERMDAGMRKALSAMMSEAFAHGILIHGHDDEGRRLKILTMLGTAGAQRLIAKEPSFCPAFTELMTRELKALENAAWEENPEGRRFYSEGHVPEVQNMAVRRMHAAWQGKPNVVFTYCLNATDFGLPQNRYRLLMLSVLTDGQRDKEEYVRRYFANHDLGVALYRDTLNIPHANLADYLRTDYSNETYYREATACQPMDTESRRRIWENNVQITDASGNILVDHVSTLTTKQDRDPNSGNLYMAPHDGLGSFRYLTPRECMILMGFDEADYEKLINNNVSLKKDLTAFPRDRIIRMAGNSIAVNVLVEVFRQMMVIHDTFYPKPGKPGHLPKTDVHDPETRSYNMSQIRAKNTKPEEIVAKHLFRAGFRKYVRNDSSLPGKPDISLKQFHTVVFINGCFWHGHEGCRYFKWPKSNQKFWKDKINANRERDKRNLDELAAAGWHVITVWECDLKERRDETLDALVHEIRQQPHRIYKKKRSHDTE